MAWPVRYQMIGLLFAGSVVNYVDRVNISVAAPVMMKELGWSKDQFGWVFSAFLIGYALLQIPGGVIADRWSGCKVLAVAFCGFSLFTLLTPWGANAFFLLLAVRFLIGVFESMTFPATASINSRWIPRPEFGRAHTFSISGINAGQMVAYPLTTWIILHSDWQTVFYINAVFGLIWAAVWLRYASDTPASHPRVSPAERAYIESQLPPSPTNPLPLSVVFTNLPLLTVAFGYMCFAYVGWMFLFWIPTYLVEARGYPLGVMGALGIPLQGSAFIGLVGGGMLGDWLLRRGWSSQFVRARMGGIGLALSLPFLLAAALVSSATLCVIYLILFYGLFHTALSCFSTVAIEFNQHLAGAIFGLINTLGTFAGFLGPLTAGYMLAGSDSNWLIPFFVAAAVGLISATVLLTVPIRPIKVKSVSPTVAVPIGGIVRIQKREERRVMDKTDFYRQARHDLPGPLAGLRVLEATTTWAGPMCACLLADFGADVIKVELPDGEVIRRMPPFLPDTTPPLSFGHATVNRNKRGLSLDLRTTEGRDLFLRLAMGTDIIVENFRPGTMQKWGTGYADVCAVKPDIIYVSITGFGQFGPAHDRPGYDPLAQATGGFISLNGEAQGNPVKAGTALADDLAGVHGALATLAAVYHHRRTGEGQHIDVALLDSLLFQSNGFLTLGALGLPLPRWGNEYPFAVPANIFMCKDGRVYLALLLDAHWKVLAQLMGRTELAEDPEYSILANRLRHRDEINAMVAHWCSTRSVDEVVSLLTKEGISIAPVRTYTEAANDPHIRARDMLQAIAQFGHPALPVTGPAAKFSRTPTKVRMGAPLLGAHDEEILLEFGLSTTEIAQLRRKKIIAQNP